LSHNSSLFCSGYFGVGVSQTLPILASAVALVISTSQLGLQACPPTIRKVFVALHMCRGESGLEVCLRIFEGSVSCLELSGVLGLCILALDMEVSALWLKDCGVSLDFLCGLGLLETLSDFVLCMSGFT
jgi:hypothetical protein